MERIKNKLAFGCMRLPMIGGKVDEKQFCEMADTFIAGGFNYFDTAHGYIGGQSETSIRTCLTSRHDRSEYLLTDKLTENYFERQEDIVPFFESQLKLCGVDYFDFYLMHAQGAGNYPKFQRCHAYETAYKFKEQGKIRHFGISFHDRAEVLEQILTDHPEIEVVQIQFNYLDYDDPAVQSRKCYDVCRRHGKKVLVMEPVKGGSLANLPADAAAILNALGGGSPASYAIRFVAEHEDIIAVLSGMSTIDQLKDNISYMKDFKPLTKEEHEAIDKVVAVMHGKHIIPCTACRYCVAGCPMHIAIPDLFSCKNAKELYHDWNSGMYYDITARSGGGKAGSCIKCGRCERVCPQHLPIRDLLIQLAEEFER